MSDDIRCKLRDLADQLVKPVALASAVDAAYKKAAPIVRRLVEDRFPPKDMRVLDKYEAAKRDTCIKIQLESGGVVQFEFDDAANAPLVVNRYCRNQIYLAGEASPIIADWVAARDKFKTERERRLADYKALILSAKFVEEIMEVWPEAENLLPKRQALVALNDDVLARIKRDIAERARVAA